MSKRTEKTPPIPPRPAGFKGILTVYRSRPGIPCAKRPPSSARKVAAVGWAWGPAHSRADYYFLSLNRTRSHWVLWLRWFESELTNRYMYVVYARAKRLKRVDDRTAAYYLLMDAWKGEAEHKEIEEPPHEIFEEGLLTTPMLDAIAEEVWSSWFREFRGEAAKQTNKNAGEPAASAQQSGSSS